MFWVFLAVVVSTTIFVLANGGREERILLATLVLNFTLTGLFYRKGPGNWLEIHWPIVAVDLISLLIFLFVALRSKRFWPLPFAALQLLPVLTPLVTLFGKNIVSYGLGMTQGIWGYLQMAILVIAAKRHQDRLTMAPKR